MPMKIDAPATEYEEIDRFEGGVGWLAHPEEGMRRASHALAVDGDVWVVDPVDAEGVDDLFEAFGSVRGVVVLLDRHARDAEAVARRHDVPVSLPAFVECDVEVETERFAGTLPGTEYEVIQAVNWPGWREAALCDGETLVVADALGTADYFTTRAERIGVHPMLRPFPPTALGEYDPERILSGHGRGITTDGADALETAIEGARARLPTVWWNAVRSLF